MLREYSLAKSILISNIRRMSLPYKLTFAATYKCNSRCTYCGIWKKKPEGELDLAEIRKFFQKPNSFNWIDITGGEIFLRDDIADVLDTIVTCCKRLYNLHFPTNGLLTGKIVECVERLVQNKPPKLIVTVSLDGPQNLHDKLRGVPGGWEKAVTTFNELIAIDGCETYFGMTVSDENVGTFSQTLDAVKERIPDISVQDFHINIAHTSEHYYSNADFKTSLPVETVVEEIDTFKRLKGFSVNPVFFLEHKYLKNIRNYLTDGKIPLPCKAASVSCFIDPQGTVYPCSTWDKPLGSLRDVSYDLKKLWDTSEFKETAIKAHNKECPNCWTPCEAYQTILGNLSNMRALL